jgi:hypothetical protein
MNANVRRLVFDIAPLWAIGILLLYAVVGMMDWSVLTGRQASSLSAWPALTAFLVPGILGQRKAPMWRVLPLTPRERARAVWWQCQGAPMLMFGGLMAVLGIIAAATGQLRSPPASALASLGELWAIGSAAIAASLATTALRRRFGRRAATLFALSTLAVILGAAIVDMPTALFDGVWLVSGALALAGAAASFLWAETLAQALPFDASLDAGSRSSGGRTQTPSSPSDASGRLVGWPTLLRPAGMLFGLAVALLAIQQLIFSLIPLRSGLHAAHIGSIVTVVMFGALPAAALNFVTRVLRSLPLGPAVLTLLLQGAQTVLVLVLFAAMQLLFAAAGHYDRSMWLAALAALPLCALRLPLHLRLGPQGGIFVGFAIMIPLPLLATTDIAPPSILAPIDLALWALACSWTWWEFARGRGAYRTWYAGAARWRGAPA